MQDSEAAFDTLLSSGKAIAAAEIEKEGAERRFISFSLLLTDNGKLAKHFHGPFSVDSASCCYGSFPYCLLHLSCFLKFGNDRQRDAQAAVRPLHHLAVHRSQLLDLQTGLHVVCRKAWL